jgi:hypothetical protein
MGPNAGQAPTQATNTPCKRINELIRMNSAAATKAALAEQFNDQQIMLSRNQIRAARPTGLAE